MKESCKEYLDHNKQMTFKELLFSYIDEANCKDSDVYKKAEVDRKLFSKIRCNKNYIPRKNVIIKLCMALGLKKQDFNYLLKSAGYSLSSSRFDLIIAYCLENNIYDLKVINEYLYTYADAIL